jgi:hypothetical protein
LHRAKAIEIGWLISTRARIHGIERSALRCLTTSMFSNMACRQVMLDAVRPTTPDGSMQLRLIGPSDLSTSIVERVKFGLRSWLRNDQLVQGYMHDAGAACRLVPLNCRFPGYEEFIGRELQEMGE